MTVKASHYRSLLFKRKKKREREREEQADSSCKRHTISTMDRSAQLLTITGSLAETTKGRVELFFTGFCSPLMKTYFISNTEVNTHYCI